MAKQFDNIIDVFHANQPQLVLLDINLPTFNGYHWCQEIRKTLMYRLCLLVQEPTIWIKLWQFKWHDDFIEKPFNLSLTVTKIQALLRRTYDLAVSNNEVIVKIANLL